MARIRRVYGETVAMTTTAAHLAVPQGYTEIKHYAASAYRLGLAPSLEKVFFYLASTGVYTDFTDNARDRGTTHVPLDGMLVTDILYMGFSECPRGVYFDIGTNVQDEAASLDVEYAYDAAQLGYKKYTGTISGALTVGETVTGQTSGFTAILVESGATYIVVKNETGEFLLGEDIDGGAETCDDVTAISAEVAGTPYWTDVGGDSDGTDVGGDTLKVDGLYTWTLPSSVEAKVNGVSSLHWIRFKPSATLSDPTDINNIIPACIDTNYGYFEAGVEYHYPFDTARVGAIETDMASGADTLDVTWSRT